MRLLDLLALNQPLTRESDRTVLEDGLELELRYGPDSGRELREVQRDTRDVQFAKTADRIDVAVMHRGSQGIHANEHPVM